MIERLPSAKDLVGQTKLDEKPRFIGTHLEPYREKINEIIDSVNDHEDMIYGCDCDDEDDDVDEVEALFGDEGEETGCSGCCPTCGTGHVPSELREVNTTDGLFADFAAYVAAHPGLRLHQAYRNWTGYSKVYGELEDGELEDTFYLKRKGPQS